MTAQSRRPRGFTLTELIVTLAIGVILMTLAIPSFLSFRRSSELNAATSTLLASLNAARGEAMKRGLNAMAVPVTNGSDWAKGWVVFVDKNRNHIYDDPVNDILIQSQESLPFYITVVGNNNASGASPYVMFDASGYAAQKGAGGSATGGPGNLAFKITSTNISSSFSDATRLVIIAPTGRVRSCKPLSATDPDCLFSSSATAF